MVGPDACRGPVDVGRLVKRYKHTNPRMQTGSPPVWLEPVSDFVLLVVCVVFHFSSRPPRAGVSILKYLLCIFLLFIFASFIFLSSYSAFLLWRTLFTFTLGTVYSAAVYS